MDGHFYMDASCRKIRHPGLLCALLILGLAGCSQNPKKPQLSAQYLAALNQILPLSPNPHALLREGDSIAYLITQPAEGRVLAQVTASCTQPLAVISRLQPGVGEKILPAPQREQLLASQQFRDACARTQPADWRMLKANKEEDWLLIDYASLHTEGAQIYFWSAYDYRRETLNRPEPFSFSQRRQRFSVDCKQEQFRQWSEFRNANGELFGTGNIVPTPEHRSIKDGTPDEQHLLRSVCAGPDLLSAKPLFKPRVSLPILMDTPEVAEPVLAAVKALDLDPAEHQLSHIEFAYSGLILRKLPFTNASHEWFIETDEGTGQLLLQTRDTSSHYEKQISFRGLFPLAYHRNTSSKPAPSQGHLTQLAFSGDWKNLPAGKTVSYTKTLWKEESSSAPSNTIHTRCSISSEWPAKKLHSQLQGVAKKLICKNIDHPKLYTDSFYYLSAYGLFVPMGSESPVSTFIFDIKALEHPQM